MVKCSRCGTGYTLATMNGEECGDTQCDGLLYPTQDGANRLWQIKVCRGELCDLGDVPVPDDVALNAIIDKLEIAAGGEGYDRAIRDVEEFVQSDESGLPTHERAHLVRAIESRFGSSPEKPVPLTVSSPPYGSERDE